MLTDQLIELLFTKDALQELKKSIEEKKNSNKRIARDIWDAAAIDIANEVNQAVLTLPVIKHLVRTKIMDIKTLKRIFGVEKEDVREDHGTRTKTINTMLVYAGIKDQNKWPLYKDSSDDISNEGKLLGLWYLYRFNYIIYPNELKRSMLRLSHGIGKEMIAEYRTLTDSPEKGRATQNAKILTITFQDKTKTRQITAYVDNDILGEDLVLNGIISSSRTDCPYAKHCLLVYAADQTLKFEDDKIITVGHSSQKPSKDPDPNIFYDPKIDPIVRYLARKRKEIVAEYFVPATISGLILRNNEYYKKIHLDYIYFKKTFVGRWYSVSSFQTPEKGIKINSYAFTFDEVKLECYFTCHRGDLGDMMLTGKMECAHDQFIFNMHSPDGFAHVNVIAKKISDARLLGSSIILTSSNNTLAREIFFRSDVMEAPIGNIEFKEFLNIESLYNYEKSFLLSKSNSEMEWPEFNIKNYTLLENYSGYYLLFLPYPYVNDYSLLQISMFINELGVVKMELSYKEEGTLGNPYIYTGHATILNNTLRISVQTKMEQRSECIFSINVALMQPSDYIKGVVLDTDRNGHPCADACLAIRTSILGFEFKPMRLLPSHSNYSKLEDFFNNIFKITIAKYFSKFPSIRENEVKE